MDELINNQTLKLKRLVKHAYKTVPFYAQLYKGCGLHPDDIKSIEDIHKVPVIDKNLLAQNPYENLLSRDYSKHNLIPVKTAGSNGSPYLFYIDHSFDQFRKAQFIRPYITNGRKLLDHSVCFTVSESIYNKWYHRFGVMGESRIFTGVDINKQIETLSKIKPDIIQGYGSVLSLLANKIIDEGISVKSPRLIFTDSELLMPDMRENIEKVFGAKVIDIYGTFETDNIAYECHAHQGYHIAMDSVIMEFLKDGKPVEEGEDGEITVTILNNLGMPFIRYNLHDIGSYSTKNCSCGRTFPLMNQIQGRDSDYIVKEDGTKFSIFSFGRFASLAPNVYQYQIIQEDFNLFTLFIVPNKSYNNEGELMIKPAIKKILPEAKININLVSAITREPSGKFKAFKSKVGLE